MTTPPTPLTMERLAFIRLLHQEAVEQSRRPAPINKISVLAFHDAVEQFLILACEHSGANQPSEFIKYWPEMKKVGVTLTGKVGMDRLNRCRKDFKHAGAPPSPEDIDYARSDVNSFFEENTPLVFGVDYLTLDMADLMPQEDARDLVKSAATAWDNDEKIQAMSLLVDSYELLFSQRGGARLERDSPFRFGPDVRHAMRKSDVEATLRQPGNSKQRGVRELAEQITKITDVAAQLQGATRIVAIGIDYHRYHRFQLLTPYVFHSLAGTRDIHHESGYDPTREDFNYCREFVIAVALRLGEVKAYATPPQWKQGSGQVQGP